MNVARFSLWLGPLAAALMVLGVDLDPERPAVTATAAVAVWMAVWWIGEAVPLAATALLPLVVFPLLQILPADEVAGRYTNQFVFLFLGGFLVALAIQRWGLHRRIALWILARSGSRPAGVLGGFMLASAFLSMWISNTAAAMMLLAIALAVLARIDEALTPTQTATFAPGLMLGVAYGASVGGTATLVGTPPNLSLARNYATLFPDLPALTFGRWLLFALPLAVVLLGATWALLAWRFARLGAEARLDPEAFRRELADLGPMGAEERRVALAFAGLVVLWIGRADLTLGGWTVPGWSRLLPDPSAVGDGSVAIAVALVLFCLPAGEGDRLLRWEDAQTLPWDVILLFGGGFALASGFTSSGLSGWIGERLHAAGDLPTWALVGTVCGLLTFLTELTSNTATAEMALPILAAMAEAQELPPLLLMAPAALACSCAFMLPVATPPNAIAFGSRRLPLALMVGTGWALNLVSVGLITAATLLWGPVGLGWGP